MVADELIVSPPRPSLWAKAYAAENGDADRSRATYILWRATELQTEAEQKNAAIAEAETATKLHADAERLKTDSVSAWEWGKFLTVGIGIAAILNAKFGIIDLDWSNALNEKFRPNLSWPKSVRIAWITFVGIVPWLPLFFCVWGWWIYTKVARWKCTRAIRRIQMRTLLESRRATT